MTTVSTGTSLKAWGVLVAVTTISSRTAVVLSGAASAKAVVVAPAIIVLRGIKTVARRDVYLLHDPLLYA
jgi:hypothetical protein